MGVPFKIRIRSGETESIITLKHTLAHFQLGIQHIVTSFGVQGYKHT